MSKTEEINLSGLNAPAPEKRPSVPSAALTPELQAFMNASLSAAIKEALAGMAPILQSIALTPEKIQAMEDARRAPTADQASAAARAKREKANMKAELEENRKNQKLTQDNCLHRYVSGALAVGAIRNYPDRNARYMCFKCHALFEPRHWDIGAPTEEWPRGIERIVDAHPQYVAIAKEWHLSHEGA